MPQLTGDMLIGDVFHADQGTAGGAGPISNTDPRYEFDATVALAQYGGEIVVTAGSGEMVTAKVVGGSHDGEVYSGTIVANDASDFLVETSQGFVYITNDPAAQPTPPADPNGPPGPNSTRIVGALGPNNTYTYQAPVCFAEGTCILTDRGSVAVEALRPGDLVVTASGSLRPIRWLGHRTIDCRKSPSSTDVWPVRIAAHALGPNRPTHDLMVSPAHAICVDVGGCVLVPAVALVDGEAVRQVAVDTITYWHVELDTHDVILANGLPAETYLEMGNRGFFTEADVVDLAARPDAPARSHADFCLPYVDGGPVVEAIRALVRARTARTADHVAC